MTKLLRLTNYQLIGLLIGIPFITILFLCVMSLFTVFLFVAFLVPLLLIFWFSIYFGWYWVLGTGLHKKLNTSNGLNLHAFKALYAMLLLYIGLSFIIPFLGDRNDFFYGIFDIIGLIGSVALPYCVWFIAKSLNTVEANKPAKVKDYIGDIFLILFFPVGILILQPRINDIFKNE